jgi:glycosyltransferase involved in cell wall biosynthesis
MDPSYGGPFNSVRRLAQEQTTTEWNVSVRLPWSEDAAAHHSQWKPAVCEIRGSVSIGALGWSSQIAREVPQSDCDVLHTHGIWMHPSWVALAWKRRWQRPHVASVRGMLEPWAWRHHAWKKRPIWWLLEQRNLRSASLLHATSAQEARSFRERGLSGPIAILPNGVDVPNINFVDRREKPSGPRTALFLSRIHPKKGLRLLIEAWAKVRPLGWQLQIAGPDEDGHQRELQQLISAAGLSEVISFVGTLQGEHKTQAFLQSDLFILPTHSENFGIAIAEALAHGIPVITTHGAPWEALQTHRCGWWVPVTSEGIAAALNEAIQLDERERTLMGIRGRDWMEQQFSWPRLARQMIECYDWLLGRGDKPGCVEARP